jgi:hypothetical protein
MSMLDGLYVLLKPEKKKNPSSREIPSQTQKIPSKLSDYLMGDATFELPVESQWTTVSQTYSYSATILLSKG